MPQPTSPAFRRKLASRSSSPAYSPPFSTASSLTFRTVASTRRFHSSWLNPVIWWLPQMCRSAPACSPHCTGQVTPPRSGEAGLAGLALYRTHLVEGRISRVALVEALRHVHHHWGIDGIGEKRRKGSPFGIEAKALKELLEAPFRVGRQVEVRAELFLAQVNPFEVGWLDLGAGMRGGEIEADVGGLLLGRLSEFIVLDRAEIGPGRERRWTYYFVKRLGKQVGKIRHRVLLGVSALYGQIKLLRFHHRDYLGGITQDRSEYLR